MKRIVGIVALAATTASLAMADVGIGINFRRGTNVFSNANTSKDSVTFGNFGDITGTDAFTFKASNEYAGITLNYNPDSSKTANEAAGTEGKGGFWTGGTGVEYTAYVNPTDWLQFKLGAHKDGIMYAEQAKKDTDDTNWSAAGRYAFLYKLGIATKNSTAFTMDDMTSINNAATPFFFADFKFNDVGPGNLLVRASLAKTDNWLMKGNFNKKTVYAAPGLVVGYNIKDLINVNLDLQMASNNDLAAGLYASPSVIENLTIVVGGTVSTVFDGEKGAKGARVNDKDGVTFFGIDLRLRYVAGDFHIANAFNFTGASEDGQVKQGAADNIGGIKARTGDSNIWDSIFLTYKLNDNWTVTGNIQLQACLGDDTILDLGVTPGVMYTIGKGATITAGVHMGFGDLSDKTDDGRAIGVALPVIFRVKL